MEITEASPSPAPAAQPAPAPAPETATTMTTLASSQPAPAAPEAALSVAAVAGRGDGKRKRGRPRKYGPDGTPLRPLNATPISASAPDDAGVGQYTPAAAVGAVMKRGRGRPVGFISRVTPISVAVTAAAPTPAVVVSAPPPAPAPAPHSQLAPLGELVACASGANFTPHIINVAAGEDVNMKVISFSQQGPRAICILSANGVIANVTLRQQDSLGGTVTYEGRFELLSLSGSFTPTDSGGTRSRSGGMSVSLAAADGRVIGGGVAGLLVAASPVQVCHYVEPLRCGVAGRGGKLPTELPDGPERQQEAGHRDQDSAATAAGDRRVHHLERGHGRRVQRQPSATVSGSERELDDGIVQGGELDGARARSGEEDTAAAADVRGQSPRSRRVRRLWLRLGSSTLAGL